MGDNGDDLFGKFHLFSFLGVDAQPGEMRQTEFGSAFRLVLGELAKVIVKAVDGTAVEPGPEGRFANRQASRRGDFHVVIGDAADHVGVRFDVFHAWGVKRDA